MSDPVTPTPSTKHVQIAIPVPTLKGVPDWRTIVILVGLAYFGWTQLGKPHLRVPWYVPGQDTPAVVLPVPKDAVETAALNMLRSEADALEAAAAALPPGKATPDALAKALHDARLPLATTFGDALQADADTAGALKRAAAIKRAYTR